MNEITRKAIADATLKVQDTARALGAQAAARTDWRVIAVPASIPNYESTRYREVYRLTAELASALLASHVEPAPPA